MLFVKCLIFILIISQYTLAQRRKKCKASITIASGRSAPKGRFCSGQIILEEQFNEFNFSLWEHEVSLGGGGNWEFQWYTNDRNNSFVKDGKLHIRPTLTSDIYGEPFLSSGNVNLNNEAADNRCTNAEFYGCERSGTTENYLNPIRSARLHTKSSFAFKYGKVEVRAKIPRGDWLWPAIWLLPKNSVYGIWPRSGEIDLMESRGNLNLTQNGVNIGTKRVASTLHFGLNYEQNLWRDAHFQSYHKEGFHVNYHTYGFEWTDSYVKFFIDGHQTGLINSDSEFWNVRRLTFDSNYDPWQNGNKVTPFDQKFYIILNLAVGGISYFPDIALNPKKKPWKNNSPTAPKDFWIHRDDWLPTWHFENKNGEDASLIIDYVKVWAI